MMEGADDGRVGASNDLDDATFGATIPPPCAKFDQHLVTAHGGIHVSRGDVDVTGDLVAYRRIAGFYESISIAMHGELAWHQILPGCCRSRRRESITTEID